MNPPHIVRPDWPVVAGFVAVGGVILSVVLWLWN